VTKPKPAFTVDLKEHAGFLDGKRIASVTQTIRLAGLSSDLRFVTDEGLTRGNNVHEITALFDEGDLLTSSVHPDYQGRFEAFRKFRRENPKFKPIMIEQIVHDPIRRVWGILDRLEALGNEEAVLDVKNGDPDDATGVQTAGYDVILPARPKGKFRRRFGLYLRDDGYSVIEYTDPQDRFVFLSALACVNWSLAKRGDGCLKRAA